ncbi:type I restriction enzyme HsdR N-terminal domain-containing protein [Flavobacterium ustbae]|uniref:type I restriction enzyme HsdR N-terminal domain-containing protein n=1 Tax=Flavobacterium ustbae TaxID=2488790 RepID=UPI000F7937B4|nr:type I restriction enzyme HsdR N-terminal domain-containing protein [Flavobacterium ustbae]
MKSFTEEEIRSLIIIPFLKDIGLSYNDLKLETSFSIQLGRGVYDIKNEQKKTFGGRLDILCKVDNKNLFIIELKAENVSINKTKDSQQGLSYARLMQPMPPYVIVTNGKETYLFDTIYGNEVDKNHIIKNGYFVSTEEDIFFRFNALKNFIGYSYKNLSIFCQMISKEHILKFSNVEEKEKNEILNKKYIPSLYVERDGLHDNFNLFLEQNELNVFAIVGASGCGKTNSILHLFNKLNDHPALFYSGTLLGNSFFDDLKFDFNLEFSPQETEISIIKKISSIAEQHNKQFILFIDAIDEWIATDKSIQLDKIIKITSRYNIKLCISCKDLLWNSLLKNKDTPTNLVEHLHTTFLIEDFTENEFKEALLAYSNILDIPITLKKFSRDMYNPFSLRIAFEVSHSDKTIALSENSVNSISLYLKQKLIKTTNNQLCKRYLYSIAQILLSNNKIHEEELKIREYLRLSINEEIPIDLFSNSLLYRNNINNITYIGFYFSKIRDYIISNEILLLNNVQKKQRTKRIIKSLDSFIGENAINFYIGNCDSEYLIDCIKAIIKFDKKKNTNISIKLIAQQNENFFAKIENNQIKLIFTLIKELIKNDQTDYLNHEEINITLLKILKFSNIELELIELLYLINEYSSNYNVYEICKLLEKYKSKKGTDKLIDLVQNRKIKTQIRRFVLDTLDKKMISERKIIFSSILNEYVEDKRGPLFYVQYWFHYIEDIQLRDDIIHEFDKKPDSTLVRILNYSKIENTGELLFSRFLNNNYSDDTKFWLCRAICSLDYRLAIPKFIEIIEEDHNSELAGHLFIGLGKMQAKELKPTLYKIIECLPETYKNETWLTHASIGIMDDEDYIKLLEIGSKSYNTPTIFFIASTLSNKKNILFNKFILQCVNNKNFDQKKRYKILHEWATNLTCEENISGYKKIIEKIDSTKVYLSQNELMLIYSIFNDNTELSSIALSILLNFENNLNSLEKAFISQLPFFKYPFIINQVFLVNIPNLKKLKTKLDNWIKYNLQSPFWENQYFLFNLIQFSSMFGDFSYIEIIENNKTNITNYFPSTLDGREINKNNFLNHTLHTIRIAKTDIRTRVD